MRNCGAHSLCETGRQGELYEGGNEGDFQQACQSKKYSGLYN